MRHLVPRGINDESQQQRVADQDEAALADEPGLEETPEIGATSLLVWRRPEGARGRLGGGWEQLGRDHDAAVPSGAGSTRRSTACTSWSGAMGLVKNSLAPRARTRACRAGSVKAVRTMIGILLVLAPTLRRSST